MSHPVYGDHWSRRYVRSAVMLSAAASHSGVELRDNRGINKRDIEVDDSEGEDNANDSDGDAESLHPFRYGHGRTVVTADLDDLDLESGDGHGGATSATRGENTDVAADEGEDVDVDAPAAAVGAEEGAETDPDRDPTTRPAVPDTPRKLGWMRRSMANLGSRKRESGVGAALERHNSNNSIAPLQRLERQNSTGTIDEPERPKSRRLLQRPRLPAPSAYSYSLRTALPRPPVTRSMSSDTATSASRAPPAPVPPCATPPRAASSLGVGLRGMDMAMGSGGAPVSSVPLSRSPTGGSDFEGPYRRNRSSKSTNNLADMLRLERDKERAEKPEKGRAERAPTERAERTSVATVASRPLEFLSVLRAQSIYRGRSVTPEPARVATPEPLEPAEPSSPIDPEPLTPGPLHDEPVYLELADADPYEEDPTTPREGAVSGITWFEPVPRRGAVGSRRTARGVDGRAVRSVYTPGWERRVLDLDARLHEAVSALAGGQPSFATGLDLELKSGDGSANGGSRRVPQTVLDLGCGTGAWAVAQAQAWPSAKFVCADLVPAQIDLEALAAGEERLSEGKGEGLWRSVVDRIKFEHYDFLKALPYEDATFDMVHMRFLGLGIPDSRWGDVLDEIIRILKPGGILEIVEMSYEAPPWAPARQRKEYTDLLLDSFVSPNPVFSLQLHLPATQGVAPRSLKPVFTANWDLERDDGGSHSLSTSNKNCSSAANCAPPALADAAYTWMSSALDYRDMPNGDEGARAVRALVAANPQRWGATELGDKEKDKTPRTPSTTGGFSIPPTPTIAPQSPTTPMTAKDLPIPGRTSLAAWVIHKLP